MLVSHRSSGLLAADGAGRLALTPFLARRRPGEALVCFFFTAQTRRICLLHKLKRTGKQGMKNLEQKKPFSVGVRAAEAEQQHREGAAVGSLEQQQPDGSGCLQG